MITRSQSHATTKASKYYGTNIVERVFPGGIKTYTQDERVACCLAAGTENYIYNQENVDQKIYLVPPHFNPLKSHTDGLAIACNVKKLH
jgi:hypothetical protein